MRRLVLDIDDTLCRTEDGQYHESEVVEPIRQRLLAYRESGFEIILHTSRNVRSFEGNLGKINARTLPTLISWLDAHDIPYDEIYVGKPWCGHDGFYVDDRAVRPEEFASLDYVQISELLRAADERMRALAAAQEGQD